MCGVTFSSHRKLTRSPHLTQKREQEIGLQLLFVCGYKTRKWSLPPVLREAAGTEGCLLAGAGAPFRSYRHRAELCTDHTHP